MPKASTQEFLEIKDVREGILVLKNNNIRGILMVSSINFALKSDREQSAIISAFQSFLNTLDFSCQIIVRSRRLNITPYLDELREMENKQTNDLLRKQTNSYRKFIQKMVKGQTIMTKNFYLVIPYDIREGLGAGGVAKKTFGIDKIKGLIGLGGKDQTKKVGDLSEGEFERCKDQLWQRMEFTAMGLKRCGLEGIPLTTSEIIELFWAIHHPQQAEVGYYPEILPELLR